MTRSGPCLRFHASSTGPVVKAILSAKYSRALAGSFFFNSVGIVFSFQFGFLLLQQVLPYSRSSLGQAGNQNSPRPHPQPFHEKAKSRNWSFGSSYFSIQRHPAVCTLMVMMVQVFVPMRRVRVPTRVNH